MKSVMKRVAELHERPNALEALRSALNQTTVFLATVKNLTDMPGAEALETESIFTSVEVETLEKVIVETRVSFIFLNGTNHSTLGFFFEFS